MTFSVNWPVLNTTMPEADFLNIIASNGFYNQELKYQGEDIHLLVRCQANVHLWLDSIS